MPLDDAVRLRHIRDAMRSAEKFLQGRSREDLDSDEQLQFALVRAIEIVGEAASRLSQGFRDDHPEIPWSLIIAMRNRLIHAYFDLDNDILWITSSVSLPDLARKMSPLFGK
ncbi:MAG: DUF86 domain-containing protein [Rhizobium sp.]|nr:DUF86 domain-containing protein [Rhizobium sp.]